MSGAQNLMELAGYAYTTLQPIIERINERKPSAKTRLKVELNFQSTTALSNEADVWVYSSGEVVAYKLNVTKASIDEAARTLEAMLAKTPALESVG